MQYNNIIYNKISAFFLKRYLNFIFDNMIYIKFKSNALLLHFLFANQFYRRTKNGHISERAAHTISCFSSFSSMVSRTGLFHVFFILIILSFLLKIYLIPR